MKKNNWNFSEPQENEVFMCEYEITDYPEDDAENLPIASYNKSNCESIIETGLKVFNAISVNPIINSLIKNQENLVSLQTDIERMHQKGYLRTKNITTEYNIKKRTLDKIEENIDKCFLQLNNFDVKNMNENQSRQYELLLNTIISQRQMVMDTLESIFR